LLRRIASIVCPFCATPQAEAPTSMPRPDTRDEAVTAVVLLAQALGGD